VAKTVISVEFLPDVARQKVLKSADVSRSYSKNNSGTFLWTTVYVPLPWLRSLLHRTLRQYGR